MKKFQDFLESLLLISLKIALITISIGSAIIFMKACLYSGGLK